MNKDGQGILAARVGLPPNPFLYTMDQIAALISVRDVRKHVYFNGRTTAMRNPRHLVANNISPDDMTPDWRVSEVELIRWLRACGFRVHRSKPQF